MSRIGSWLRRSAVHKHIDAAERRIRERIENMSSKLQGEIDRLKAGLEANTSATSAMTELFGKFVADVRENADDATEIRAIADAYESNTAALVAAAASGTPAAEAPAAGETGGEGGGAAEAEAL